MIERDESESKYPVSNIHPRSGVLRNLWKN